MQQRQHEAIGLLRRVFKRARRRAADPNDQPTAHGGSRPSREIAAQALRNADAHLLGLPAHDRQRDSCVTYYYSSGR